MNDVVYFHIGCTYSKEPILQCLIENEFKVIIVDEIGIRPIGINFPYYCVFDKSYDEIKSTILEIIELNKLDIKKCFFFTLAEGSVDLLNQILKDFNKDPVSHHSGSLRNKYWVRKKLEEHQIEKISYHALVKNPAEIPNPPSEDFPLIVKPIGSMESRNVFKVNNHDELRKSCLEIFTKSKTFVTVDHSEIVLEDTYKQTPHAVIETCLRGEKISLETLVIKGKVKFFSTTVKYDYENDFFYERADIVDPFFLDERMTQEVNGYLEKLINALEIDSSILHIEVFLDRAKSKFHLIEVNFRMSGGEVHELISKTYGIDLIPHYLKMLAGQSKANKLISSFVPTHAWISFYFMTHEGGQFTPLQNTAFDSPIEWHFKYGDRVTKFTTSKFYKLGTIVFPATKHQILPRLDHLFKEAELYFTLKNIDDDVEYQPLKNFEKSKKHSYRLLKTAVTVLYIAACFTGSTYLYKSFKQQTKSSADTMSKTLAYHLANGETYYVANIVHNFQIARTYGEIVVTDKNNKVIYSVSSKKPHSFLYQETIDPTQFDETIPIKIDGIEMGSLAYNLNYTRVVSQLIVGFLLISALLAGLYFLIVKYLFGRVAISAQSEAEHFISIVDKLNTDLERFHEKNTAITFEKYDQLLKTSDQDPKMLSNLYVSLRKLVNVLKDLRSGLMEKNRLADLLDESTKQLVNATTQAEIAKVAAQLSHDIRSPLAALKVVRDLGAKELDPEQAKLLTMSIDRITDIANTILPKRSKDQQSTSSVDPSFIWMFIDQIISEKRVEYKNSNDISISLEVDGSPFQFNAFCNPNQFMRAVSNIINNSIEAKLFDRALKIKLKLKETQKFIEVSISDNGKGIEPDKLNQIFNESFSHGKNYGTGLGLFQVKQSVESWDGSVFAESEVNVGTTVYMRLKKSKKPKWLTDSIQTQHHDSIIVLDDEEYVFSIIKDKFDKHFNNIRYFKRIDDFESKLNEFSKSLLFIDYDLKQHFHGIDLIKKYNLQEQSILLTGNYDDKQIQLKALDLGINILPKPLINDIPVIS